MTFEPGSRAFTFASPRLEGLDLAVLSMRGEETLSRPFRFDLTLVDPLRTDLAEWVAEALPAPLRAAASALGATLAQATSPSAPAVGSLQTSLRQRLLGHRATFAMGSATHGVRRVHGVVSHIAVADSAPDDAWDFRVLVRLVPRLALLRHRVRSRIFQDVSVRQIARVILAEHGLPLAERLLARETPRAYCVQYRESDLAFLERILGEEGIAYTFAHEDEDDRGDVVVLSDGPSPLGALRNGTSRLLFARDGAGQARGDHVVSFERRDAIGPDEVETLAFDVDHPALLRGGVAPPRPEPHQPGDERPHRVRLHQETFHGEPVDPGAAAVRLQQLRRHSDRARGVTRCRALTPGVAFFIEDAPDAAHDGAYQVESVEHDGRTVELLDRHVAHLETYSARFTAIPDGQPLRPPVPSPRPLQTMETATVVGPGEEPIHTDVLGRVRVRFHWDEQGASESSSCWMRTMQSWSGPGFGAQFIPRVGMEVVVAFFGGDVDQPICIGCVPNAQNLTPFSLPDDKTRSGFRTQSAGGEGFNELSFDDAGGQERVRLRSSGDLDLTAGRGARVRVESDLIERIGAHATRVVGGAETVAIAHDAARVVGGSQTEEVEHDASWAVGGHCSLEVGGALREHVVEGRESVVDGTDRRLVHGDSEARVEGSSHTLVLGDHLLTVGSATAPRQHAESVRGDSSRHATGRIVIDSDVEIELRCGRSTVRLLPDRIVIDAERVIAGTGRAFVELAADAASVVAAGVLSLEGVERATLGSRAAELELGLTAALRGQSVILGGAASNAEEEDAPPVEPTTVELRDERDHPVPHARYRVLLPDGSERMGALDEHGRARLLVPTSGRIEFPDLPRVQPA